MRVFFVSNSVGFSLILCVCYANCIHDLQRCKNKSCHKGFCRFDFLCFALVSSGRTPAPLKAKERAESARKRAQDLKNRRLELHQASSPAAPLTTRDDASAAGSRSGGSGSGSSRSRSKSSNRQRTSTLSESRDAAPEANDGERDDAAADGKGSVASRNARDSSASPNSKEESSSVTPYKQSPSAKARKESEPPLAAGIGDVEKSKTQKEPKPKQKCPTPKSKSKSRRESVSSAGMSSSESCSDLSEFEDEDVEGNATRNAESYSWEKSKYPAVRARDPERKTRSSVAQERGTAFSNGNAPSGNARGKPSNRNRAQSSCSRGAAAGSRRSVAPEAKPKAQSDTEFTRSSPRNPEPYTASARANESGNGRSSNRSRQQKGAPAAYLQSVAPANSGSAGISSDDYFADEKPKAKSFFQRMFGSTE